MKTVSGMIYVIVYDTSMLTLETNQLLPSSRRRDFTSHPVRQTAREQLFRDTDVPPYENEFIATLSAKTVGGK